MNGQHGLINKSWILKEEKDMNKYDFRSAVVDECGDVVAWVDEIGNTKAWELIDNHPEWNIVCIDK